MTQTIWECPICRQRWAQGESKRQVHVSGCPNARDGDKKVGLTIDELEAIIAEHFDGEDRWYEYLASQRLDAESCGIFCGRLAKSALERAGLTEDDAEWQEFGPAFTTVALCAFEAALRLKEAQPELKPVG